MQRYVSGRKLSAGEASFVLNGGSEAIKYHPAGEAEQTCAPLESGDNFTTRTSIHLEMNFAVVESRCLLRDCFSMFLSRLYDADISGFETVEEMLDSDVCKHLDLVVMGASTNSRQIMLGQLSKLCRECGSSPVIVMQDTCDYGMVSDILRVGARGVVPTTLPSDVATEAISLVMAGGSFIPAESLMQASDPKSGSRLGTLGLTPREEQVLALLRAGKQNKQIAYSLGLSEGTVKVHLHNLMKKLGTSNRTQTILAVEA
jgi:DNA-binding NarL/FixJ family response regulator